MLRYLYLCGLLAVLWPIQAQGPYQPKVLFLGNSYTAFNDLPNMVREMGLPLGDTITTQSYTPGGYRFLNHSTDAQTLGLLAQGDWDVVVLQEQSQWPSFPLAQVQTGVFPYATSLTKEARSYSPCSRVLFYMTWGRENGDATNCQFDSVLCTYAGMQQRLRDRYLQMAQDNEAEASPVGMAWARVREERPWIQLYTADGSHPSFAGSYLAAATFYASIFRRSPQASTYRGSLPDSTAAYLRSVAALVVLDSQTLWRLDAKDPLAAASPRQTGAIFFAQNLSQNAYSYEWDFGDGNQSTDVDPVHLYADTSQTYTVRLVALDSCGLYSDTAYFQVSWSPPLGLDTSPETKTTWRLAPNPAQTWVGLLEEQPEFEPQRLRVYNSMGQLFREFQSSEGAQIKVSDWPQGLYFIEYKGQVQALLRS